MNSRTENTPIYFEVVSEWMAAHEGRMPGVVPASGEPERNTVVNTPYLDDVAKNGISPWGRNRRVTKPVPNQNP